MNVLKSPMHKGLTKEFEGKLITMFMTEEDVALLNEKFKTMVHGSDHYIDVGKNTEGWIRVSHIFKDSSNRITVDHWKLDENRNIIPGRTQAFINRF